MAERRPTDCGGRIPRDSSRPAAPPSAQQRLSPRRTIRQARWPINRTDAAPGNKARKSNSNQNALSGPPPAGASEPTGAGACTDENNESETRDAGKRKVRRRTRPRTRSGGRTEAEQTARTGRSGRTPERCKNRELIAAPYPPDTPTRSQAASCVAQQVIQISRGSGRANAPRYAGTPARPK